MTHTTHKEARPGELETMREGVGQLLNILSWSRPHASKSELAFMRDVLLPAIRKAGHDPIIDDFGNVWVDNRSPGAQAEAVILWSCHVDTVAKHSGRQGVKFADDGRTLRLSKQKPGRCLGADDGAGVWLLLEMLKAGIAGGYVFHRGEEQGRLGSEHVARSEAWRLKPFDACVAFDRRGTSDVITHQLGLRTASDGFGSTIAKALNLAGHGLSYVPDDGGAYTDSYSYAEIVAECSNISAGYYSEHGPRETLDCLHLWRLREAILSADFSGVVVERDPSEIDYAWGGGYGAVYGSSWGMGHGSGRGWHGSVYERESELEKLIELIRRYPAATADLLQTYGLGADELLESMTPTEQAGALGLIGTSGGGWSGD